MAKTSTLYRSDSYISQSASSQLARLMSQENILVEFNAKDETASFNIVDRTLRLPVYKNMTENEVSLFIAHEISHAINTTSQYLDHADKLIKKFNLAEESAAMVMNIVEDVRIEKLIKRRYPGLKKDFYFGYKDLTERLKTKNMDASAQFVDRFNHFYKFGHFNPTTFTAAEQVIVDAADKMETLDDVYNVAEQLVQHYKDNKMMKSIPKPGKGKGGKPEDGDGENTIPSNGEDMGFVSWGKSNTKKTSQANKSGPPSTQPKKEKSDKLIPLAPDIMEGTVDGSPALYDHAQGANNMYVDVPLIANIDDLIIKNTDIRMSAAGSDVSECDKFIASVRPLVSLLASMFNRKKQATEYRRATLSESGSIDPQLLTKYKFVDNIFKSFSVVKKGKKHGVVMYLDWSGSMSGTIHPTAKQAIIVMELCRRINIPFELFAFSNSSGVTRRPIISNRTSTVAGVREFRLLNFVSSTTSVQQYKKSLHFLWSVSRTNGGGQYSLSGTPLNESLFHAFSYIPKFKQKTGSELVSLIVLTDGDTDTNIFRNTGSDSGYSYTRKAILRHQFATYKADMDAGTDAIVKAIRDKHKVNAVCFYIQGSGPAWRSAKTDLEKQGYNERLILSSESLSKLTFGSDIQKDREGKILLDRFISLIAEKYHAK